MATSQVKPASLVGVTAGAQLIPGYPANTTGYLHKVRLVAAAANATAQLYAGTSTAGVLLATLATQANWSDETDHMGGLSFTLGLFVVITGAGAAVHVTYE